MQPENLHSGSGPLDREPSSAATKPAQSRRLSHEALLAGVRNADRRVLGRAISLVENHQAGRKTPSISWTRATKVSPTEPDRRRRVQMNPTDEGESK